MPHDVFEESADALVVSTGVREFDIARIEHAPGFEEGWETILDHSEWHSGFLGCAPRVVNADAVSRCAHAFGTSSCSGGPSPGPATLCQPYG